MIFFSSRRRHTRYWRDWSSDVCSSDLGRCLAGRAGGRVATEGGELPALRQGAESQPLRGEGLLERRAAQSGTDPDQGRDRRSVGVGKECSSRGAPIYLNKKTTHSTSTA